MIKFVDFFNKNNININGVLHLGAHRAEEEPEYLKLVPSKHNIIWVEANPSIASELRATDGSRRVCIVH